MGHDRLIYDRYTRYYRVNECKHIRTSLYVMNCLELLWYCWVAVLIRHASMAEVDECFRIVHGPWKRSVSDRLQINI